MLNVQAAVGSAPGVRGYSVVTRWMMVVMYQGLVQAFHMRAVDGLTVEQLC